MLWVMAKLRLGDKIRKDRNYLYYKCFMIIFSFNPGKNIFHNVGFKRSLYITFNESEFNYKIVCYLHAYQTILSIELHYIHNHD